MNVRFFARPHEKAYVSQDPHTGPADFFVTLCSLSLEKTMSASPHETWNAIRAGDRLTRERCWSHDQRLKCSRLSRENALTCRCMRS